MSYVANLRTFVRVYELGSMSAAGRDQRISAAVASARIAELERHLGVRLFNRTTRSLQPTEQGAIFYQGARQDPRHHRRGRGRRRRRLAEPARLAARRRPPRPRQAADRPAHPRFQRPLPGDRRPPPPLRPPRRHHRRGARPRLPSSARSRIRPSASGRSPSARASWPPPLPTSRPIPVPAPATISLDQRHACLLHRYPGAREFVWTLATPAGPQRFDVSGPLESDDGDVLTAWAIAGRGIILKPAFEIAEHLASGALVPVCEDTPPLPVSLACLYPAKRLQDPKSRLFIDFMVAALKRDLARILAAPAA